MRANNQMKIIMENWRRNTLEEASPHSDEWISQTTVADFLNAYPSEYGSIFKQLEKKYPEKKGLFGKIADKLKGAALGEATSFLIDNAKELALATSGLAAAGATGGSSLLLTFILNKGLDIAIEKGSKDIKKALSKFDVPDSNLETPAENLVDLDDEFLKVLKGPDGDLDRDEMQALFVGLKEINKIMKAIAADYESSVSNEQQANQWRQKTMDEFGMDSTLNNLVKKAYSKLVGLNNTVEIPRS